MPKLKSPTTRPIICTNCNQPGGQQGQVPLRKLPSGKYAHDGPCPKLPRRQSRIILPTNEQVAALEHTKEVGHVV